VSCKQSINHSVPYNDALSPNGRVGYVVPRHDRVSAGVWLACNASS